MCVSFNKVKNFMGTNMYLNDKHLNFRPKKTVLNKQDGLKNMN